MKTNEIDVSYCAIVGCEKRNEVINMVKIGDLLLDYGVCMDHLDKAGAIIKDIHRSWSVNHR